LQAGLSFSGEFLEFFRYCGRL